MRNYVKQFLFRFESSFFSKVLRRALGMMIPLILTGGMALALRNLPIPLFQAMIETGSLHWLYDILTLIYEGTFGLFSVILVVTISLSYAMELNVAVDYMVMYVIVALSAFGAQVNIGTDYFDIKSLGSVGCFSAILVAYLSCMAYSALRKIRWLILENFTAGMGGICLPAFQTFFPLLIICSSSAVINRIICMAFHVHGSYELINVFLLTVFKGVAKEGGFTLGLLYTVFVHLLWFFGLHGSHILEPVAQNDMICNGVDILSKSFYDVFVSMGGSGTTVCVIIALLMLYRRERSGKLAGLATVTGLFNINEILTFGLPIILNPILFVPFILTPVACYCISYGATAMGLVPVVTHEVVWTAPVLVGGYLATGSIRGTLLQLFCIGVGVLIYIPFLRANQKMETIRAKEQVRILIKELQSKEENIEHPMFLTRGDHIGTTSRLLLHDLKHAVKNRELHILYQPQVRADGSCIGAEALLRWNHPLYGMIYPPLIIYLAEEGKILPDLEKLIIDEVVAGIARTKENYSGEFKISVNFTAHSLLWDCENYIEQELERNHVEPDKLWIEITEQDILIKTDLIMKKLNQLKENGHRLLIDDFGMGHTSLLYLQSEIFSVVKLDSSLTRPLLTSETNQKIVSSIVELGNELNVDVIAEYVETREQQKLLEKLGCTCYQGYLYSKPIPLDEFIQYIRKNQTENE